MTYRVSKEEYSRLAELIVKLFPFESKGTYYTPAGNGQPARGKLYSAYQNYRTELIKAGLTAKRERSQSEESNNNHFRQKLGNTIIKNTFTTRRRTRVR